MTDSVIATARRIELDTNESILDTCRGAFNATFLATHVAAFLASDSIDAPVEKQLADNVKALSTISSH